MPVDEAPEDDRTRQSYNVAPGYYEPVYRADVPDWGAGPRRQTHEDQGESGAVEAQVDGRDRDGEGALRETKFKLQSMKWGPSQAPVPASLLTSFCPGLIPFWTKRNPDYGSMLKTINCRDDSLIENRGMWNTMKQRKRCIVLCQGFYEWLKKNGGKEKIPHFVKRTDERLMCFAGLWDCAQYEGESGRVMGAL